MENEKLDEITKKQSLAVAKNYLSQSRTEKRWVENNDGDFVIFTYFPEILQSSYLGGGIVGILFDERVEGLCCANHPISRRLDTGISIIDALAKKEIHRREILYTVPSRRYQNFWLDYTFEAKQKDDKLVIDIATGCSKPTFKLLIDYDTLEYDLVQRKVTRRYVHCNHSDNNWDQYLPVERPFEVNPDHLRTEVQ